MSDGMTFVLVIVGVGVIAGCLMWLENWHYNRQFRRESEAMCAGLRVVAGLDTDEDHQALDKAGPRARMVAYQALHPEGTRANNLYPYPFGHSGLTEPSPEAAEALRAIYEQHH